MNTKIIKIADDAIKNEAELRMAGDIIRDGGLVVFPTETVYGLGADATNPTAVRHIYEAKGRPSDNPLIIHISTPEEAERYTLTTPLYDALSNKFMPGPLTVVMKSRDTVPSVTRGGLDTVAVRCPKNNIARELIARSGTAIAAPSANLSGTPSPTSFEHVRKDMYGRVDAIIDGGDCDIGLESTIIKIDDDNSVTLLRPGKITVEELLTVVNEVKIADSVTDKLADGAPVLSPGMKYRHYAPRAALVLVDAEAEDFIAYVAENKKEATAVIAYSEYARKIASDLPDVDYYDFGSLSDATEQARRLFSILRKNDELEYSTIYAPLPDKRGIGLALYNRMIRAAAHKIIRLRR